MSMRKGERELDVTLYSIHIQEIIKFSQGKQDSTDSYGPSKLARYGMTRYTNMRRKSRLLRTKPPCLAWRAKWRPNGRLLGNECIAYDQTG